MNRERFEGVIQEAVENEPLKKFDLKLLGTGADKMVFETAGSDRKIIKVNTGDVITQVSNLLGIEESTNARESLRQTKAEHQKIEDELAEIFGQEHLLRKLD